MAAAEAVEAAEGRSQSSNILDDFYDFCLASLHFVGATNDYFPIIYIIPVLHSMSKMLLSLVFLLMNRHSIS